MRQRFARMANYAGVGRVHVAELGVRQRRARRRPRQAGSVGRGERARGTRRIRPGSRIRRISDAGSGRIRSSDADVHGRAAAGEAGGRV